MDLYSRKIVGRAMSSRMTADLVCTTLQLAIQMRQPPAGLILHFDQSSQYCSAQYQSLLSDQGFRCSMLDVFIKKELQKSAEGTPS